VSESIEDRLRKENSFPGHYGPPGLQIDAADEITRLRARVQQLEAALQSIIDLEDPDDPVAYSWGLTYFQRARAIARAAKEAVK
jgi:hypothetical protein